MKRYVLILAAVIAFGLDLPAQTTAVEYADRYALLVNKLGPTGVGIETLVERWEKDFPDDRDMLVAKFQYYFNKAQSVSVVEKDQSRFMGNEPLLSLSDSLGNTHRYFQEIIFDDGMYSIATQAIEKAIRLFPNDLELTLNKIAMLLSYEKESPDMATAALEELIDHNGKEKPVWIYQGTIIDDDFFCTAVQDYCVSLYTVASPSAFESFRTVSEKMNVWYPGSTLFLDNIGTYYFIAQKDYKKAAKYYNKVLKMAPEDYTAIKNSYLMAVKNKDVKKIKKFLQLLSQYSPDRMERESTMAQLKAMNK